MNIIISGYGKMGKLIHQIALEKEHNVLAIIDNEKDWDKLNNLQKADVLIDFSTPQTALLNIEKCFDLNIPIVTGTTGWHDKREYVKEMCIDKKQSLFYAPNFSIGVNLFFEVNALLAQLMSSQKNYKPIIKETHHTEKLDSPSGTAIKIAEMILEKNPSILKWTHAISEESDNLHIISERKNNIIGMHSVTYTSDEDELTIEHNAKNRNGFAQGAILAAEWLIGRKGFFEMKDMLNF